MICSLVRTDASLVPEVYQDHLQSCLSSPRPGVDVVFCTETHLVEVKDKRVIRTARLETTDPDNQVTEIRMVLGDEKDGDWKYLLVWQRGGLVQFLNGETLHKEKEYTNVKSVDIEDHHNNGRRLVALQMAFGEKILTDGSSELEINDDLDIMEISDEKNEEESEHFKSNKIAGVLAQRLEQMKEAIVSSNVELEMKEKMIEESLQNMYIECGLDKEVIIGSKKNKIHLCRHV